MSTILASSAALFASPSAAPSSAPDATPYAAPSGSITDRRRWWALAVVVSAQFMFVVDAFIVNVAIPTIRRSLGTGGGEMEAVIAIYQIAYASLVITGGRLGDIMGRRRVFIAGVLAFTTASVWCGLATSGIELVLGRLLQGATAALMVPQVLATIHALFPDDARARAFAVFGVTLGLGGAVGFALGGWLVTLDLFGLGWRSVFLVNLPVGLAVAAGALLLMPEGMRRPGTRLDLPGAVTLFFALIGLIGPFLAGRELGWPVWLWLTMAAGGALLPLFARWERRVERRGGLPLVSLGLLRDRRFRRGLAAVAAFQSGNVSFYLLMTLFMQNQLGFSPVQSGWAVVPLAVAFTIASQLAGGWVSRHGIRVLLLGCGIQLAGLVAVAGLVPVQPDLPVVMAVLPVFGFGQGLVMAPLAGLVLTTVPRDQAGVGSGLLNTVHQGTGAFGVAAVGLTYAAGGPIGWWGTLAALDLLGLSVIATAWLLVRMGQEQSATKLLT
ncbi:MAG: MFS transporter [Rhodopila sp.]